MPKHHGKHRHHRHDKHRRHHSDADDTAAMIAGLAYCLMFCCEVLTECCQNTDPVTVRAEGTTEYSAMSDEEASPLGTTTVFAQPVPSAPPAVTEAQAMDR